MPPNFVPLDATVPDDARLLIAMVQARDAVGGPTPHCGGHLWLGGRLRAV
jgi:hypothetical protein